jgi:penicillin amidase
MALHRACFFAPLLVASLGALGCTDDDTAANPGADKVMAVPESESWTFPELEGPVYVLRVEGNVPHVYAAHRNDLGFVLGFITARDRWFMMDLERRLGKGIISELLGDAALAIDQESRGTGMRYVASQIEQAMHGDLGRYFDSFAAGANRYIDEVAGGRVPAPSELGLASALLGVEDPVALMKPFDRSDIAAMITVIIYNSSYETDDIERAATVDALPTLFEGAALQDLRRSGALEDLYNDLLPVHVIASAPGFIQNQASHERAPKLELGAGARQAIERLRTRMAARRERLGRDPDVGWGSNAWAVSSAKAKDGYALMAGDGHLSLAVPPLLFRMGLDTTVFGDGLIHQEGLTIPGLPVVALGTNGSVAWSQTQIAGDITDWYSEELLLSDAGVPVRSRFQGEWKALYAIDEDYVVADIEALGSIGRTETWQRWETFDHRWIAEIEGRVPTEEELEPDADPPADGTIVNLQGTFVIPKDMDNDGVISAVSFDYAGFDAAHVPEAFDAFGQAKNVNEFLEAAKGLVANSLNYAVADVEGSVMYGSFQPFPCRTHLDRAENGEWLEGSNPQILLDGTKYGSFTIPIKDGRLDETPIAPDVCGIPYAETPHSINPEQGFVVTANNDPGGMTFDNSITNDGRYFGGPWNAGFRAHTIASEIETAIAEGTADIEKMSEIQGNVHSTLAHLLIDDMLEAIDYAAALPAAPEDAADARIAEVYQGDEAAFEEVKSRLTAWRDHGLTAWSGVETFYDTPSEEEKVDAVATMIFNAWMSRVIRGVFDDEALPGGVFRGGGNDRKTRALGRFLAGRGAGNAESLASFNPDTEETAFFDVLGTPEVETSREVIIKALADALAFLRSTPDEEAPRGTGGFGTDDMSQWLWGLRHYAKFESLLGDFITDPQYLPITKSFAINTDKLPLAEGLSAGDPRADLEWFPRDGDQFSVDAANPGTGGTEFGYGSGPVMRMVVALKPGEVRGVNIIPGGQSALTDSPYFADQARLWLANETTPFRFTVDEVVAYEGVVRETYSPAP